MRVHFIIFYCPNKSLENLAGCVTLIDELRAGFWHKRPAAMRRSTQTFKIKNRKDLDGGPKAIDIFAKPQQLKGLYVNRKHLLYIGVLSWHSEPKQWFVLRTGVC